MKAAVPLRLPRTAAAVAAVAARGSAACAAQALHVSPSAVTRAVQQAEALLGLPLFARRAHGRAWQGTAGHQQRQQRRNPSKGNNATEGSDGINTTAYSRETGGGGLAGRATALAEGVAGGRSGGGPGVGLGGCGRWRREGRRADRGCHRQGHPQRSREPPDTKRPSGQGGRKGFSPP